MELKEFLNNKALKAAYNDEDNDRGGHFTYWFDCSPFDDAENTLIGWIEEYIKLTNDDLKPVEIPEITDEEIEYAINEYVKYVGTVRYVKEAEYDFRKGIEWYREELKKRMK